MNAPLVRLARRRRDLFAGLFRRVRVARGMAELAPCQRALLRSGCRRAARGMRR